MDIILKLKEELNVEKWQVEAAVKLIDEGNTIPFISRYRKEVTGSLNDEVLRNLHERLTYLKKSGGKEGTGSWQYRGAGKAHRGAKGTRFWQQKPWLWWKTCTVLIVRSAKPRQV